MERGRLDDRPQHHRSGANVDPHLAAPGVNCRPDEGNSNDAADLVHGRDDSSPGAVVRDIEVAFELIHGEEGVEHAPVEAIAR